MVERLSADKNLASLNLAGAMSNELDLSAVKLSGANLADADLTGAT